MKITVICKVKDNTDFKRKLKCINSQTYRDIQAIFVCDSRIEVNDNAKVTPNIELIYRDKSLFGVDLAQRIAGEYCVFIDHYDYISVDYIRMMVIEADKHNSDVITCDIAYRNDKSGNYEYSNLSPLRSLSVEYDNAKVNEMYEKYKNDSADIGMMYGKCIRTTLLFDLVNCNSVDDIFRQVVKHTNIFTNIHGAYYFRNAMNHEEQNSFFNGLKTTICKGFQEYEQIKTAIASDKYQVISFDVFDTLILRNVYEPTDLFQFMDDDYNTLFDTTAYTRFFLMRINAEKVCRKRVLSKHRNYEDVTLDEIYDTIADLYHLDSRKLALIKKREIELEYEFCIQRKAAKELYDFAIYCGKKVICMSDMYLPADVIKEILTRNGYDKISDLYISSETRVGKWSGKAFKKLPEWTGSSKDQILHIGDNPDADVKKAKLEGIDSFYFPKALDLFWGNDVNNIKGESAAYIFGMSAAESDYMNATQSTLGLRCMLSQIINKFFDNPFTGFNSDSDYDCNPYYIGFFALGMHLYALVDWITSESDHYKKVHFLSRDGYLMKQVYDIINQNRKAVPSAYTYMSRNIVALCDIAKPEDLWAIREKITVYAATCQKLVTLLKPGIPEDAYPKIISELKEKTFAYEEEFGNEERFAKAVNIIAPYIDWNSLNEYREKLKKYYNSVFAKDECVVDAGYNGRVEASIEELCGLRLDSFYLHAGEDMLYERENRYSFSNKRFYRATPITSFLIREHFLSQVAPSVSKIEFDGDDAHIIFSNLDMDKYTEYITLCIQNAAIEFANCMMNVFGKYQKYIKYQYGEASRPFDYLCNHGKETDISVFSSVVFEDLFGGNRKYNLAEYWRELLIKNKVQKLDSRNMNDYLIFKKYYLRLERILPKNSKRRALIRNTVKMILGR